MDGIKLLVTRPQPDADRTAAHLDALGIVPVLAPLLVAQPKSITLPDVSGFGAIAITSANAIRFLATQLSGPPPDIPVFTVGDHSAHEARIAGFTTVFSAQGTLHDLVETIVDNAPSDPIFYPAAHHQSGDLAGLLGQKGYSVQTEILYEMVARDGLPGEVLEPLLNREIAGALFYSRRTAEIFAQLCKGHDFAPVRTQLECLCISENCAEPLMESRFVRISLADDPDHDAMMTLALAFAREQIGA